MENMNLEITQASLARIFFMGGSRAGNGGGE